MSRISRLSDPADLDRCAAEMVATDPWIKLGRTYEQARPALDMEDYEVWGTDPLRGFIVWTTRYSPGPYIRTLCTFADSRGQGVGRQLLEHAERTLLGPYPNLFMCVSSFNPRALALYLRVGFEQVGAFLEYIIPGHSELLLRRTTGPRYPALTPRPPLPRGSGAVVATVREASEEDRRRAAGWMTQSPPWSWLPLSEGECLAAQGREALVACVDGEPRALAGYRTVGTFNSYLHTLCVEPGWSGRGLGSQLLEEVERRAFGVGPNVFLSVADFLPEVRRFYEARGYALTASYPDYLAPGQTQWLLRKTTGPTSLHQV